MPELNFGLRGGGGLLGEWRGRMPGHFRAFGGGYARTFGGFGVCRKSCGLRGAYAGTVVR